MPGREDMPSTVRRSPAKAQRTYEKVHDKAVEQYGEGELGVPGRSKMTKAELARAIAKKQ